jgi:hypothetical protein
MNNTFTDDEPRQAEVITATALESATKAEYDISIATAHKFPRFNEKNGGIKGFLLRAESLATATPEIAASMEYAKPVGGEKVKGPSARLAEIVAATYGNLRVQARVISETDTEVVAQGIAHDLESNVAHSTEASVSLLKRDGRRVGPEQVMTARGAACSKARRNAVFLAVPAALLQPIIEAARACAAGDIKTLPERRKKQLDWFAKQGIKPATIFAWLGVKGEDDIGLEHMADMLAAVNAAKEDGTSLAAIFAQTKDERLNDGFGGVKKTEVQGTTGAPIPPGTTQQNGGAQ